MDAALFCLSVDAFGERGGRGRHISSVCACIKTVQNTLCPEIDLLDILRIADDGDDCILPVCAGSGTVAVVCTCRNECIRLGLCAVIDGELIAGVHEV